jgi:formate C-acetyltransferase
MDCIEDAAAARIPLVVQHLTYTVRTPAPGETGLARLRRIGEHAAALGVRIAVENMEMPPHVMAALDTLVLQDKVCTLSDLLTATQANFEGYEALQARCHKAPKYGTGNEMADGHAVRLLNTLLDVIDREATNEAGVRDVYTLNVTINDMNHRWQGGQIGATVDGRCCTAPLSENMSPTVGNAREVTTLLSSVAKLPTDRLHAGALNVRLRRDVIRGDAGLSRLRALIETYFKLGGMQLQVNLADTAELRAAQKNPDAYRDLSVRITGYSAIFVDMAPSAQEEIIRRDELG